MSGASDVFRSQSREDIFLWEQLYSHYPPERQYGGAFIEIGALNGVSLSNSWHFEKRWDWRGLLIEGHPSNSAALRVNQPSRANAAIFTASVCGIDLTGAPGRLQFTSKGDATGAAREHADPKFIQGWHASDTASVSVDCVPLQHMLDATGIHDVDLFSLDVEGAELAVLQTVDWTVTNIHAILVELDAHNPEKDQRVRDFLQAQHFVQHPVSPRTACCAGCDCTANELFVKPTYEAVRAKRAAAARGGAVPSEPGFWPPFPLHRYAYGTGTRCSVQPQ